MGIDIWNFRFLVEGRGRGAGFGDLLQVGRQGIHIAPPEYPACDRISQGAGLALRTADVLAGRSYADEGLFQALGAQTVTATDASPYEGAEIIQDFNDPVPAELHQRFDTVFDGGSLEHIFNVPTALANMMSMLRVGGRLMSTVPANNWLGHGFYQFGPQLPFRVFTPENGFALDAVFLPVMNDPDIGLNEIREKDRSARVEIGRTPVATLLMFIATKQAHVAPFGRWPQQSDYAAVWNDPTAQHQDHPELLMPLVPVDRAGLVRRGLRKARRMVAGR